MVIITPALREDNNGNWQTAQRWRHFLAPNVRARLARAWPEGEVGRDEAIRLADLTTLVVPRFVPSRSRDPRAPQNLVPIGALEQHLRRGLGDARLIHRRLASLLARELSHV